MTSILPPNATPLERALEAIGRDRLDAIPIPIADIDDPALTPADFLPFVGWERSVDLWDRDWPEEVKRAMVREAVRLHRLKGTLAGVRAHLAFTAARLLRVTRPPQAIYLSPGLSADPGWEAWRTSLPEIRLKTLRLAGTMAGTATAIGHASPPRCAFFRSEEDDRPTLFLGVPPVAEEAVVVRGGVETPATFRRTGDPRVGRDGEIVEFFLPRPAGRAVYLDHSFLDATVLDGRPELTATARVAFAEAEVPHTWNMLSPSPYVQDVVPERGRIDTDDKVAFFLDHHHLDRDFIDAPDPDRGTYRAFRLMETPGDFRAPASFLDHARFGMPAHTAELMLAIPSRAGPRRAFLDCGYLDFSAVPEKADLGPLAFAAAAVNTATAVRDDVFLDLDIPSRRSLWDTHDIDDLELG